MEVSPLGFDYLASCLDKAVQTGHLPDPGKVIDKPENSNIISTPSYIRALRARLIDLGYLGELSENRNKDHLDDRLKRAIKKYQEEAGLLVDSWAGKITWGTLQKLVSFEDEQDPGEWGELLKDLSMPAISRGVYLRLYVLGFFDWKNKLNTRTEVSLDKNEIFFEAFDRFLQVAEALKITNTKLDPEINKYTLRALYQQDEITKALARNENRAFVYDNNNEKFIHSAARIELWMLGFDLSIGDPRQALSKKEINGQKQKLISLEEALDEFWEQQGKSHITETFLKNAHPTPEFFQQIVKMEEYDNHPDSLVAEDIVERVRTLKQNDLNDLKRKLKSIATSIWDGVKRAFRWIKSFFKKIISTATNVIKNLARLIANTSREIFRTVIRAFEIVHHGIKYLFEKTLPGSDAEKMVICHDKDLDLKAFIHNRAYPDDIKNLVDKNYQTSVYFGAGCRIMGFLMAILSQVAKSFAAGIGGWFLVLLALSRLARSVKGIADEVKKVDEFEIDLKMSPFSNDAV